MVWGLLCLVGFAMAQDAPEPKYDGAVDTANLEDAVAEKPETKLSSEFGGTLTAGNARFFTLTGAIDGAHKWSTNQVKFSGGVNLSKTVVDANGDGTMSEEEEAVGFVWSSQRIFGSVRYDRFFGETTSLYVASHTERDPFAGLHFRVNEQFGYSKRLSAGDKLNTYAELGLAYTQEGFVDTDVALDAHYLAGRINLVIEYTFSEDVSFSDTVEAYENLFTLEDLRLNNTASLTTRLSKLFSVKLSHRLAYDHLPVEGFRPLDHTTLATLVASIF